MKSKSKKGWKTMVTFRLRNKSASRFRLFPKVKPTSFEPGSTPVYLNVYDLTPMNGYFYWAGLGIFHSGVEVHGVEYAFGAHDFPTSGVFEVEPRQCPGFKFRESILIGRTSLDPIQVRQFMEHHSTRYNGNTYHLLAKNCNHFCKDICYKLTGKRTPKWVNRLAKLGSMCNCILPDAFKTSVVRHEQPYNSEKKRLTLTCSFSFLSSLSMQQKSAELLKSPQKGLLSPWGSIRSDHSSVEEKEN
ncbi:hypothetical protein SLEP1_g38753 [Rubroshorea leprosula]|uniref:PPPDE domain-containing protein n=1 Tax=Rubroshorea leprosula TaxID=152421 RepID=A0AAV5KYG6_9ROSI|nr:hypothetical protein SLEP1_g38753 [Rubroshorea leprosula]